MKKTVIIAAAGVGSRLGAGIPKCLVEVNGHPIFEYQIRAFCWADEIHMVVGYRSEEVMARVSAVDSRVMFVQNPDYANTTTLQSNFLGARNVTGKALFIDGDMIISQRTSEALRQAYEQSGDFIGVAGDLSEEPVYTGVENGQVRWFSYDRPSGYEWANAALLNVKNLEYNHTHFFVQLEKFLPTKALIIDRMEIDTPEDLRRAEQRIASCPNDYDFWRE